MKVGSNDCKLRFKRGKIGQSERMPAQYVEYFKPKNVYVRSSTRKQRYLEDPQAPAGNFVVDHRSVFIQKEVFDCRVEAIWESRASVFCNNLEIRDSPKLKHSLKV